MKKLYLLILAVLLNTLPSRGQNYQCLQYGPKHYFINSLGYLRGIRIDSFKQVGDTSIYYPFHTLRGNWSAPMSQLDSNGGSWLGKTVMQLSDGSFIFDNEWSDSVVIKTQANIGDSWVFYKDSSPKYYKAVVVAFDTMTVSGSVDSIKTVMINAYDSSGVVHADPLDSFKMVLSKSHGFVQVFDLYTFPYHMPGGVYTQGLDFFLDKSTITYHQEYSNNGKPPNKNISIFKRVDMLNPNSLQLYTWHPGCVYEYKKCMVFDLFDCANHYTYPIYTSAIATMNNPSFLIDTTYLPEQFKQSLIYYYHPLDTSYCMNSASYEIVPTYLQNTRSPFYFEGAVREDVYKIGLGHVYSYLIMAATNAFDIFSTELIYYHDSIDYLECGPNSVRPIAGNLPDVIIYPNPASSILNFECKDAVNVSIYSIEGKILINQANARSIDISNLPGGIYFVMVYNTAGSLVKVEKLLKN